MLFVCLLWTLGDLAQRFFFENLFILGVTNGDNVVCCFNFEMRKVCRGQRGAKGEVIKRSKRLKNCICRVWMCVCELS